MHPDPDEDDLDTTTPPQPVFHAEQALLGALLLDPHRLDDVSGVSRDSFSTAAHAALFAAISTLPRPDPTEHAKNADWLTVVLTASRDQSRGLTPSYLQTLLQECPWPRHAPAYARMVEAEHARRRLRKTAAHLLQTVQDTTLPHPVETVLAEAEALARLVDDIAARFLPRAGILPRTPPPQPPAPPDTTEAVEEEQILLATATAHPADVASARWLLPEDFTQPLHAGLWQCLTTLVGRREPVDPVTVLWEAQQRGLLDGERRPGKVLRLLAEPAGSVEHWGERVLQRSVLATADHAARRIEAYADDPANTLFQLIAGARRALADIHAIRTRWHHATTAAPPPKRHPAPGIRARPPTTATARSARTHRATR